MAVRIKLTGVADTVKRMQAVKKKVAPMLRKAGNEGTKVILPVLKANMPTRKKEYGIGGASKKSLGRKVSVKKNRLWFGVGPRTKWTRQVTHPVRFFRNKATGRIHRMKAPKAENQQPSRKMHFVEARYHVITRTAGQTARRAQEAVRGSLEKSLAEV